MKISLITVCHNSKEDIAKFVISFLKYHSLDRDQIKYEFVFVENSGQQGLREVVQPLRMSGYDVLVVDSKNEGFGIACNLGVHHSTGDLLVFVNPDIKFLSNLDPLAEFAANASWGSVRQLTPCGKMYSIDFFPEYKTLFFELIKGYRFINQYPNIFVKRCYVVGSFLVVERKMFERSGGFNPAFFLYYEEAELCRRLQVIGGPPLIEARISVFHEGFGSHETIENALNNEAKGFLTYCQVTSQLHLIHSRLSRFSVLGLFSNTAKQRYSILKNIVGDKVFK
jgi:GT2 family glycosyltransferase